MTIRIHQRFVSSTDRVRTFSRLSTYVIAFAVLLTLTAGIVAQQQREPDRGFVAAGSYALSNIETINTTNGNLMLNIPIASLPPGPGPGFTVNLLYNSKLYDSHGYSATDGVPVDGNPNPPFGTPYEYNVLEQNVDGGWQYGLKYELRLTDRFDLETSVGCSEPSDYQKMRYRWRLRMKFPDGSVHEFRPTGYTDTLSDGYFEIDPNGFAHDTCNGSPTLAISTGMVYYSTDGSYTRLEVEHTSTGDGELNPWTLYFPDGRKVVHTIDPTDGYTQRTYDRNDNWVDVAATGSYGGETGNKISDQYGRSIIINSGGVHTWGVGGEHILTPISFKTIYVRKEYNSALEAVNAPTYREHVYFSPTWLVVDEITLPVGEGNLKYKFEYNGADSAPSSPTDGWGELASVELPSTAKSTYTYLLDGEDYSDTNNVMNNWPTQKVLTYDCEYDVCPDNLITETWTYTIGGFGTYAGASTITGPDGGATSDYTEGGYSYKTVQPDGTVTERLWAANGVGNFYVNFYVKTEFTTIDDKSGAPALTAIKDYTYDRNGNVLSVKEYDWVAAGTIPRDGNGRITGTGIPSGATLKRETVNGYYNQTPNAGTSSSSNADIYMFVTAERFLRALAWSEVRDGSGTPKTRSEMTYDDPDDTANPTQARQWDNTLGGYSTTLSSSNALVTSTTYNSKGQPTSTTDPNGVVTHITYGAITGPGGGVTDLYPTTTVSAYTETIAKTSSAVYDFYTGVVTTATDVDNSVSTVTAYDQFGRPTLVKAAYNTPVETRTAITYGDVDRHVITKSDLNVAGDGKIVKIQHYDQLGRVRLTRMLEDAATQSATEVQDGIKVQTRYGYVDTTEDHYSYQISSNPYRAATSSAAASEDEMGWTLSKTWANGSKSTVETFTGAGLPAPIGSNAASTGAVVTLRDANKTFVRDQAEKWRMSETNALGQLVKVTEDPTASFTGFTHTGTNLLTEYSYDTLSNLTGVSQAYSGGSQTRTFAYSSVSRLLTTENPESGTITYSYDRNGNLTHKQDARGVDTSYVYDELNRPTTRTYDDGTPTVTYTYDGSGVPFGKGRLASVSSTVSTTSYTKYDATGKLLESSQTTDGLAVCTGSSAACLMTYKYNLAGALTEETYPSGRVVHHNYAANGKPAATSSRVTANRPLKAYAQNFIYNAAGAVTDMQLGNMRWESTEFNSRLQPVKIALGTIAGADDMLDLEYGYGTTANNGNVMSQTISVLSVGSTPGFVATQTYTYDELNRLKSATENSIPTGGSSAQSWKQTYSFDRFGNRRFDTTSGATTTIPGTCSTAVCNPTFDLSNNRFADEQGYDYDDAGNVTQDAEGKKFVYDAENKQKSFGTGGDDDNGGTYFYDGDGKRVKKQVGTEVTVFVYNAAGQLVAEYATTTATSPLVNYLTADTLGSPRVNTDASGTMIARHDYMPFGEEIFSSGNRSSGINYGADDIRMKFTGYERDADSGLDFARSRYFNSKLGRFTSPDPLLASSRVNNSKTWNRYAYVLNNPLNLIDPTGMYEYDSKVSADDQKRITKAFEKLKAARNRYKVGSKKYDAIDKVVKALGEPGTNNGITVYVDNTLGTPGETVGALNLDANFKADGTGSVGIFLNMNMFEDNDEGNTKLAEGFGHEGSHASEYQKGFAMLKGMSAVQVENFSAAGNIMSRAISEVNAYRVMSYISEAILPSKYQNRTVNGFEIWNRGWSKLSEAVQDANRDRGIRGALESPAGSYKFVYKESDAIGANNSIDQESVWTTNGGRIIQ